MKGQIHIYTGNGKGKTTAAVGLAVRAAGSGKRILFTQFVKGKEYHEVSVLKQLPGQIDFRNYGRSCFFERGIEEDDFISAKTGFEDILKEIATDREIDMIILDEMNIALYHKLLSIRDIIRLIKIKPEKTELIMTGRYASKELIALADLVTEMKEIKHYYLSQNLLAREGIEY